MPARRRGLAVMASPSHDVARQSGTRQQIADRGVDSCRVKLPMFARTVVVGPQAQPLFAAPAAR